MTPVSAKLLIRSQAKPGFHGGSDGKESACNVGDLGSIPGLGRSPGEDHLHGKEMQKSKMAVWGGLNK